MITQMEDPERILYPLKRAGNVAGAMGKHLVGQSPEISTRIRTAIREGRDDEVLYHVGRPGDDSYIERVLQSLGHRRSRLAHQHLLRGRATRLRVWMGFDRPSADHAQRQGDLPNLRPTSKAVTTSTRTPSASSKARWRARNSSASTRLSNTASMSDDWLAPWPGTEAAMLLAIAGCLLQNDTWRPRVRPPMGELGGVRSRRDPSAIGQDFRHLRRRDNNLYANSLRSTRRRGGINAEQDP